jgi:hypothetical protein
MERIESLNTRLRETYGVDTVTGQQMWRIVFSDDQYEKRKTNYTDAGILLLTPEIRELPKYKQWVQHKWVLENLVVIPEQNREELAGLKVGYELIWVFQDDFDNPLPPKWEVCQLVISMIETAKGQKFNGAKYTEDPQAAAKELAELEQYLHGNETDVTDALKFGEGVVVPSNYTKE